MTGAINGGDRLADGRAARPSRAGRFSKASADAPRVSKKTRQLEALAAELLGADAPSKPQPAAEAGPNKPSKRLKLPECVFVISRYYC